MRKIIIKEGDKYNRFTIIKEMTIKEKPRRFLCKCECGNEKEINLFSLTKGKSKSCGCYNIELVKKRWTKHKMSKTDLYCVFKTIQARCNNKKVIAYKDYDGRGIKCKWETFEEFYKDIGNNYKKGLSLDRKNNDGNYCKSNCRWATWKEQSNNKRSNLNIKYKGKIKTLAEWCDKLGLSYKKTHNRINRLGWNIEKTFNTN